MYPTKIYQYFPHPPTRHNPQVIHNIFTLFCILPFMNSVELLPRNFAYIWLPKKHKVQCAESLI